MKQGDACLLHLAIAASLDSLANDDQGCQNPFLLIGQRFSSLTSKKSSGVGGLLGYHAIPATLHDLLAPKA